MKIHKKYSINIVQPILLSLFKDYVDITLMERRIYRIWSRHFSTQVSYGPWLSKILENFSEKYPDCWDKNSFKIKITLHYQRNNYYYRIFNNQPGPFPY